MDWEEFKKYLMSTDPPDTSMAIQDQSQANPTMSMQGPGSSPMPASAVAPGGLMSPQGSAPYAQAPMGGAPPPMVDPNKGQGQSLSGLMNMMNQIPAPQKKQEQSDPLAYMNTYLRGLMNG